MPDFMILEIRNGGIYINGQLCVEAEKIGYHILDIAENCTYSISIITKDDKSIISVKQ